MNSEADANTGRVCTDFIQEVNRKMGLRVFMLVAYDKDNEVIVSKCVFTV